MPTNPKHSPHAFLSGGFAPALESPEHIQLKKQYDLFIGGKWTSPASYFETSNPATNQVLAQVGLAAKKDVNQAVKAARKAYQGPWGTMT